MTPSLLRPNALGDIYTRQTATGSYMTTHIASRDAWMIGRKEGHDAWNLSAVIGWAPSLPQAAAEIQEAVELDEMAALLTSNNGLC